jgi:acetyltransferase-like isoleucine patch superfamily enzyme
MTNIIYKILDQLIRIKRNIRYKRFNFKNVILGDVDIVGDYVKIGMGTYMNSGRIASSPRAKIDIGKWCAIGFNVNILAISHNPNNPTGLIRDIVEKDITIGNGVWIGSNVVILPGIKIGNYSIIGANAVVTKDVLDFQVVGGIPAKLLYVKNRKDCEYHINFIEQRNGI